MSQRFEVITLENNNERVGCKYIYFLHDKKNDKPKTQIWNIYSYELDWLGVISWHTGWRCYSFRSTALASGQCGRVISDIWFESHCLRDILDFCDFLTEKHRKKKQ